MRVHVRRHLWFAAVLIVAFVVLLAPRLPGDARQAATPAASPAASPAGGAAAAAQVTVEMIDITYVPKEFTIPANTDVVVGLPNTGSIVHNFLIDALGINSGDVPAGGQTTVTINAPAGSYEYYCSIVGHKAAGMFGTMTVQ